jgi:hypothetical protein
LALGLNETSLSKSNYLKKNFFVAILLQMITFLLQECGLFKFKFLIIKEISISDQSIADASSLALKDFNSQCQ